MRWHGRLLVYLGGSRVCGDELRRSKCAGLNDGTCCSAALPVHKHVQSRVDGKCHYKCKEWLWFLDWTRTGSDPIGRGGNCAQSVRTITSSHHTFPPHLPSALSTSTLVDERPHFRRRRRRHRWLVPEVFPLGASSRMSYPQSNTPSVEHADPFGPSAAVPRRYLYNDNDSDNVDSYGRRDTYASDSSNNGLNDPDRYYDHNGTYDPYGRHAYSRTPSLLVHTAFQRNKTRTRTSTSMGVGIHRPQSRWDNRAWNRLNRAPPHLRTRMLCHPVSRTSTPLGQQSARYHCPRKKSRTSFLTWPRSLVSNGTQCGTWSVFCFIAFLFFYFLFFFVAWRSLMTFLVV